VLSIAYKNRSREQRREEKQESSWGAKVRKRTEKRHLEAKGEHRKRFGLTGVINNGPNSRFKGHDLVGSLC